MKIEYLPDGTDACPLIRLFAYRVGEVDQLRRACRELADGDVAEFVLHDQPWVRQVRRCRFIWRATPKDVGVRMPAPGDPFVLAFSDEAWREVEEKLSVVSDGFNWLTNEGEVNVLISPDGQW